MISNPNYLKRVYINENVSTKSSTFGSNENISLEDLTYDYMSNPFDKNKLETSDEKYIMPENATSNVLDKNEPYTPLTVFQVNQYQSHQGDTGDYTNDAKYLTLPELSDYELVYKKPNTKSPSYANLRKLKK